MEALDLENNWKFGLRKILKLRKFHEESELMKNFLSPEHRCFEVWTLKIFQLSLDLVTIEDWT